MSSKRAYIPRPEKRTRRADTTPPPFIDRMRLARTEREIIRGFGTDRPNPHRDTNIDEVAF